MIVSVFTALRHATARIRAAFRDIPGSPASLWRRLAAIVYDGFLLIALWIITTFPVVILLHGHPLQNEPAFLQALLYLETCAFYTYFWRMKGQTLGMQVWRVKAVSDHGQLLSFGKCAARCFFATFSLALLGLGLLWMLFDPKQLAWHDRASGTCVIYLGRKAGGASDAESGASGS